MAININRTKIAAGVIKVSTSNNTSSEPKKQSISNNNNVNSTTNNVNVAPIKSDNSQLTKVSKVASNQNIKSLHQTSPLGTTAPQQRVLPTQNLPLRQNFQNNSFGSNNYSSNYMNSPSSNYPPYNTQHTTPTDLPMNQKIELIKRSFKEVLGREATDRDTNYHKYGVVTEESMRKKLVRTNEHKEVLKKGREYDQMKENYEKANAKSKLYESKIRDHMEEFKKMKIIFNEKNRYINELRAQIQSFNNSRQASTSMVNQHSNFRGTPSTNATTPNVSYKVRSDIKTSEGSLGLLFVKSLGEFLKSLFNF